MQHRDFRHNIYINVNVAIIYIYVTVAIMANLPAHVDAHQVLIARALPNQ